MLSIWASLILWYICLKCQNWLFGKRLKYRKRLNIHIEVIIERESILSVFNNEMEAMYYRILQYEIT